MTTNKKVERKERTFYSEPEPVKNKDDSELKKIETEKQTEVKENDR